MTNEQKAAYIIAQAAVLNATVTGMTAENYLQMRAGAAPVYDKSDFDKLVIDSGLHHNAVIGFFHD